VKPEPHTYIGIDLGGARGKTTAVARLSSKSHSAAEVVVEEVSARCDSGRPWRDEVLLDYVRDFAEGAVVAIDAPLTAPACVRCRESACPGQSECRDPAVVWIRTAGADLIRRARKSESDLVTAVPTAPGRVGAAPMAHEPRRAPKPAPYVHRCTEIHLHYERGLIPRDGMGKATSPIAARAAHLCRRLKANGFELNRSLVEVVPRATVQALFGSQRARGYKRDADPWETRASIVDGLADLRFAPTSRLAKEAVLRNDHCFEALLSGYTAYLFSRDGWTLPLDAAHLFAVDGWIWAPPG
jgi:predicted nuclease with RNAse H fold